ncbi:hypothetical protein CspeluHIS016_0107190 [Cutaneotrichosporon spelunceum]|uniref:Uncharacterized protein n=1 Tax=Cutaneotrichosporon spelunceum TaxID=1672016 RepID=A0AAD3TNI4_9TREE|nr:hypothetical protein CspeluHIS016_0107190 [Cutaneotrichosporon spelunceum]
MYDSTVPRSRNDSYFGLVSAATSSATSLPAQSPSYVYSPKIISHPTIQSESPAADGLAYDSIYDSMLDAAAQQTFTMSGNADYLSSTPRATSWVLEQSRVAPPPGNGLQADAVPMPPQFVQSSPVPAQLTFPDARFSSEGGAMLSFPSSQPNTHGPTSQPNHVHGRDQYGHEPDSGYGQNYDNLTPYGPIASSSSAYADPVIPSGGDGHGLEPDSSHRSPARWYRNKLEIHEASGGEFYDDDEYEYEYASGGEEDEAEDEMNGLRYFNPAYLSETAVQVRDRVIRGTHTKGGITFPGSFTGTDLVHVIGTLLPPFTRDGPADRRFALQTAKSLKSQLWVVEADWMPCPMRDSPDDVFKFMSDMDGMGEDVSLPKGVLTMATKCYSSSCNGKGECYSPRCPYMGSPNSFLTVVEEEPGPSSRLVVMVGDDKDWTKDVSATRLAQMTDDERKRQTLIRQAIINEERYEANLGIIEQTFLIPLQSANPPIVQPYGKLDQYVRQLFSNVVEIRRSSQALLDNFAIRLREQGPLVQNVGDIFLDSASQFRSLYSTYIDNLPKADALLNKLMEEHLPFSHWMQDVSNTADRRLDLRYLLKHPASHLQNYPQLIQDILDKTPPESPDCEFLKEALGSIQNISYISRLKLFQASKGHDQNGKLQWGEIVSPRVLDAMSPKERRLQYNIWELISTEMQYVGDLDAIDTLFVTPLRESDKAIIERSRLEVFIDDVFHNYRSLLDVHERLLADLHQRQLEQHPQFGIVSDLMLNAVLLWHEAYIEYLPHYPIAKAKVDEEQARNPAFAAFLDETLKNPASHKFDITHYINRPVFRLPRYEMLLEAILKTKVAVCKEKGQSPDDDPDIVGIPQVIDLNKSLTRACDNGVAVNKAKVELWALKTTVDGGKFGSRAVRDLDLLSPMRELIHQGKVFRQPENTIGGSWTELNLLLFDNYFVQVKQVKSKTKDAPPRYSINRRPIPLELLKLGHFNEAAQTRSIGVLNKIGGKGHSEGKDQTQSDSRTVYPFKFSIIGAGLSSGMYTLWTDSASSRDEWHEKLKHAKVLRDEVDEANKVFEFTPLSLETFYLVPGYGVHPHAQQNITGRVTCSVPFTTVDDRKLVAIGCESGVWIGVQHEPPSLKKVLHVKDVTHIAVLEEFSLFLVLAGGSLLAYHLEALVPTQGTARAVPQAPQRLSGGRDVFFFSVGQISGRTLVIYAKRKGIQTVFKVLEPILSRGLEDRRRLGGLLSQKSDLFRIYKEFFIPMGATRVHFLRARIAIVLAKGFEVLDLTVMKGAPIPHFDPNKTRDRTELAELERRCENAKPMAMFRASDHEFLLCYDSFGFYVDQYGEPNRGLQAIEWEGKSENIVFHPPYLLIISPSFIEVRHMDTAKLLQIYVGMDIRCTWDGTGGMLRRHNDVPGPKGYGEEVTSTEPRIHICKRTADPKQTNGIEQQVFELTPTLLLNNPLLNPIHTQDSNYFPPAPLDHRTSMAESSCYGGVGYAGDSHGVDKQSVSSASTAPYPNQSGFGSQGVLHGRRTADMSTSSVPQMAGGSGFEMPTVYQNEVRDDYEYLHRGPNREHDNSAYQQAGMPHQRHMSNEWPTPVPAAEAMDGYAGGGWYQPQPRAPAQSQYSQQQAAHVYQQQSHRGPSEYAQASQEAEFGGYRSQQHFAAEHNGYEQYQSHGYQGGQGSQPDYRPQG